MKNLLNKIFNIIIVFIFSILFILVCYKLYENITKKSDKNIKIYPKYYVYTDTLSLDNVYKELLRQKIKYPDIVLAQCILETGSLKSYNCRVRNNLFGFYNGKKYLSFKHWKDCIKFKKKWQDKYFKGGDYYRFLLNIGYSEEDSIYIMKVKKIKFKCVK